MQRVREHDANTVEAWDRIYSDREFTRRWTIWRDGPLVTLLDRFLPNNSSVLHVGCGAGICAEQFETRRNDLTWTLCDLSHEAVRYLKEDAPVRWARVFQCDLSNGIDLPDGSFDVVLCAEVLEHLQDPAASFAELRRLARQRVIVTVPLANATDSEFHLWSFSNRDLLELMEPHGKCYVTSARSGAILFGVCQL